MTQHRNVVPEPPVTRAVRRSLGGLNQKVNVHNC